MNEVQKRVSNFPKLTQLVIEYLLKQSNTWTHHMHGDGSNRIMDRELEGWQGDRDLCWLVGQSGVVRRHLD